MISPATDPLRASPKPIAPPDLSTCASADDVLAGVLAAEAAAIEERRARADIPASPAADTQDDLVGLAVSGGGLRSALFNLGLLQAFKRFGLLKSVDYLSSVSGGGYVAGYLQVVGPSPERQVDDAATTAPEGLSEHDGKFRDAGKFLGDPFRYLARHGLSTLPIVGYIVAGLICLASALALTYRTYDLEPIREFSALWGLNAEILSPFLPSGVVVCVGLFVAAAGWLHKLDRDVPTSMTFYATGRAVFVLCTVIVGFVLLSLYKVQLTTAMMGLITALGVLTVWLALIGLCARQRNAERQKVEKLQLRVTAAIAAAAAGYGLFLAYCGMVLALASTQSSDGNGLYTGFDDQRSREGYLFQLGMGAPGLLLLFIIWKTLIEATGKVAVGWFSFPSTMTLISKLFFFSVALGLVTLLGNQNLDLGWVGPMLGLDPKDNYFQNTLRQPLLLLVGAALLPLFNIDRLLQSARPSATFWERTVFNVAMWTIVVGIPLVVFGSIVRENVSGFANHRNPTLLRSDVHNYRGMLELGEKVFKEHNTWAFTGIKQGLRTALATYRDHDNELFGDPLWPRAEVEDLAPPAFDWNGPPDDASNPMPGIGSWWRPFTGSANEHQIATRRLRQVEQDFVELWNREFSEPWLADQIIAAYTKPNAAPPEGEDQSVTATQAGASPSPASSDGAKGSPNVVVETASGAKPSTGHAAPATTLASQIATYVHGRNDQYAEGRQTLLGHCLENIQKSAAEYQCPDESEELKKLFVRVSLASGRPHDRSVRMARPGSVAVDALTPEEWRRLNRLLLEGLFPELIRPRTQVSTLIVPLADQYSRADTFVWSLFVFALGFFLIPVNGLCSGFWYYRGQIAERFLTVSPQVGDQPAQSAVGASTPVSDLTPWKWGGPYPLFNATLHSLRTLPGPAQGSGRTKPTRTTCPFVVSPLYSGDYHPSPEKASDRSSGGRTDFPFQLADAVTISGGAVSPLDSGSPALACLLGTLNLRTTYWTRRRTPCGSEVARTWPYVSPFVLAWEASLGAWRRWTDVLAGTERKEDWSVGALTDGGVCDFLGIQELLRRRCRIVICSDAGQNVADEENRQLAIALRNARQEFGIEIIDLDNNRPIDLDRLHTSYAAEGKNGDEGDNRRRFAPQHFVLGRIQYPATDRAPAMDGLFVYIQMAVTGDEDVVVQQYHRVHKSFPHEHISNQFFGEDQVEAFRSLGFHTGELLCRSIPSALSEADPAAARSSSTAWWACDVPDEEGTVGRPTAAFREAHAAPTTEQLARRLEAAYVEACRRETAFSADDVQLKFDVDAYGHEALCCNEAELPRIRQQESSALHRFEHDSAARREQFDLIRRHFR